MFAYAITAIVDAAKAFRKKPEPRPDELFAGAPRPSTVLVELICADWIKNGVRMSRNVEERPELRKYNHETYTMKTDWYLVEMIRAVYTGQHEDVRWRLVLPCIELSTHETALLKAAKKKADQLAADRAVAEREAKGQEAALKAIEKYLGITNKPTEDATA